MFSAFNQVISAFNQVNRSRRASTPERSAMTDTTWITRESVEDPDQLEDILDIQDMLVPTALADDGKAELRELSERQESEA